MFRCALLDQVELGNSGARKINLVLVHRIMLRLMESKFSLE